MQYFRHVQGCLGRWIALRQIHCEGERGWIRCAIIKLHWNPLNDACWQKAEWGWEEGSQRKTYAITEVAVFQEPVYSSCTHQGLPCELQETALIKQAVEKSRRFTNDFPRGLLVS